MTAPCLCRYVKVHLIPLDASRACAFYCCTASEPQCQMSFNEGFCILVPAHTLAACALQLSVCSLGPQAQEELLVGLDTRLRACGRFGGGGVLDRTGRLLDKRGSDFPPLGEGHGPGEPGRLRGKRRDGLPLAAGAGGERDGVSQIRTEDPEPPQTP